MLWRVGGGLVVAWFVLYFVVHQRGWVHLLLLSGISFLLVQFMAYRKTKYLERVAGK
jgi:phosphoglycerol transferase MdoB-like AlkP superfamily enzyme